MADVVLGEDGLPTNSATVGRSGSTGELPGYEFSFWTDIGAPRNTPAEIVDKLNAEINAALADPRMKARLADFGGTPLPGSPVQFDKLIAEETEKWGKVIRAANIKAGRLRALGVANATRIAALPDVPAVAEFVPGYEAGGTQGIGAPRNTPVEIIDKLNREINAGLADPTMRARIAELGNTPLALSPAEYGRLLAEETEKWGKVVKFTGIKPE